MVVAVVLAWPYPADVPAAAAPVAPPAADGEKKVDGRQWGGGYGGGYENYGGKLLFHNHNISTTVYN